jgi:predicted transcriptional regulator
MAIVESFECVPSALGAGRHWVLRKGKQPVDRYGNPKGWKLPSFWSTLPEVLEVLDKQPGKYDGIGWIVAREPGRGDKQIIGGDFDCCRDPVTGQASGWVMSKLMDLLPYVEVSPSECGFRWFAYGKLPDGLDSVTGTGPDDLSQEMRDHICEVKPSAQEKLARGENPFNNFEIYEHGRHLTVTGWKQGGFPAELEDRTNSILKFIAPYLKHSKAKGIKASARSEDKHADRESAFKTLARLDIRDVIDCAGFTESGGQLFGPHPTLGSTTGKNLVIDPKGNRWAYMHNQTNSGGGPVEWLAAESGAIGFEDSRSGCLAGNREAARITLEHAVRRGLIQEEEAFSKANFKRREKSEPEKVPEEITAKALEILQSGDPIQYIADSCGRMVLGAEKAFKKLVCCISVQNIKQSSGLHPKLSGESGGGKTAALLTFAHHLPPEMVVFGSTSSLAAFYHEDGDRIFRILDDYNSGNDILDAVIKQTSSIYHERYKHRTTIKQKAAILEIGSEQTWAITSVDGSQDIQVLNRQIPINADDSEDLTRKVNARTIQRYGEGDEQFPVDDSVLVCREIFRLLRDEGYINVRVPYWQRIDWLDTSNRRNPSIFMDLLIAHTAMNRYQRVKDEDGYYLATEADFNAAKALFADKDAEELVHRLTRKEREFADLLSRYPGGLTREEVAEYLDISPSRVSQLANGERGKGGLTQKLVGFSAAEITDSKRIDDDNRRATKKTLYKLSSYDPLTGFDAVVVLREKNDSNPTSKPCKDGVRVEVRKNLNDEIDSSKIDNNRKDIGCKDSKEKMTESHKLVGSETSSSLLNQEKSLLKQESIARGTEDTLTQRLHNPNAPNTKSTDADTKSLPDSGGSVPERKGTHGKKSITPKPKERDSKHAQSPEFERFKGLLRMCKDKGPFHVEEFLKRCDMSGIARVQAKRWIQAFTEGEKIKSDGSGMLEVSA